MPEDKNFEVPDHLRWVPPAPDPDRALKVEAHNDRVAASIDALHMGMPLRTVPTWEQRKAEVEAKAAAVAKATKDSADRAAKLTELEAGVAKLAQDIQAKEAEGRRDAMKQAKEAIVADRRARGKRELSPSELTIRAHRRMAKEGGKQ